jgi:hypothetical protein
MTRQAEDETRRDSERLPGGEPLWCASLPPANSISSLVSPNRVKTGGSRERSQRDDSPLSLIRFAPANTPASRRDVPGSRLLRHFLVGLGAKTNIAKSSGTFQSGSPPWVGSKQAFSTCLSPVSPTQSAICHLPFPRPAAFLMLKPNQSRYELIVPNI